MTVVASGRGGEGEEREWGEGSECILVCQVYASTCTAGLENAPVIGKEGQAEEDGR